MEIIDHIYGGQLFKESPNQSGNIDPKGIVFHYPVSEDGLSVANFCCKPDSRVSYHVIIGTDGTVYQIVPFNKKAWHAGPSYYDGLRGLNSHSIGIALAHIGYLEDKAGVLYDSYGRKTRWKKSQCVEENGKFYPPYTDKQLDQTATIVEALKNHYGIYFVTDHEAIDTRGWKSDTGPSFPMRRFKILVENDNSKDNDSYVVLTNLNIRGGPDTSHEKLEIAPLYTGTLVEEIAREGNWSLVIVPSQGNIQGWVHNRYLASRRGR